MFEDEAKEIKKIKNGIIKKMKAVGTYDKSFDDVINLTARILYDYEEATKKFKDTNSQIVVAHTNKNGTKNLVKNPFYLAIEKLRIDGITYLRELGLTPSGLKKIKSNIDTNDKSVSKLESALSNFDTLLE